MLDEKFLGKPAGVSVSQNQTSRTYYVPGGNQNIDIGTDPGSRIAEK